jgi:hypothetical protein
MHLHHILSAAVRVVVDLTDAFTVTFKPIVVSHVAGNFLSSKVFVLVALDGSSGHASFPIVLNSISLDSSALLLKWDRSKN